MIRGLFLGISKSAFMLALVLLTFAAILAMLAVRFLRAAIGREKATPATREQLFNLAQDLVRLKQTINIPGVDNATDE
jgi:hypothetical protein